VDDPLPLTEEEFSARANLIGSVTSEQIAEAKETLAYTDELSHSEPVRLRYAVRYVNAAGQRASFSNFLLIEPAASVSQPPAVGQTPEIRENAVIVRWEAPSANVDNTRPANLLGYNVYRSARSQNEPAQTPLNSRPVNATSFADQTFAFGEEYVYVVRAVSLGTGGEPVESLNSNPVEVKPRSSSPPTRSATSPATTSTAPQTPTCRRSSGRSSTVTSSNARHTRTRRSSPGRSTSIMSPRSIRPATSRTLPKSSPRPPLKVPSEPQTR
jgi:hypothetical protein